MLTAPPSLSLPLSSVTSWPSPRPPSTRPRPVLPQGEDNDAPSSRLPPVLPVTSFDLTYRGEGADHVVLGVRKLGQVLRLRKTDVGSCVDQEDLLERAWRDVEVLVRAGRPVLGRLLTDAAHLLLVSPRPHSALSDALHPSRPCHRKKKQINPHGVACICPDATTIFIPRHDSSVTPLPCTPLGRGAAGGCSQFYPKELRNVCVEIKPKQGFLDQSTSGLPLCRYCVKQYLEGVKKSGTRSGYCPLDLFSGRRDRMRRAVDSLFQCPQNNLKVFVDGEPVQDITSFHYLRDTIISALTFDLVSGQASVSSDNLSERSPLGRILTFQSLDRLGVFRASGLYLRLCNLLGGPENVDKALYDLSDWPTPALDLLEAKQSEKEDVVEDKEGGSGGKAVEMVRLLQSYLLSTTAKDLSLMILLSGPHYSPAPELTAGTSPFIVSEGEAWFKCQVTGVDIVAKPTSKIIKHQRDYERLREMLLDLKGRGEEPQCCRGGGEVKR